MLSSFASLLSNGYRINKKASAKPCIPIPEDTCTFYISGSLYDTIFDNQNTYNLTNRSMSLIRCFRFQNGIKIDIDNFIQITSNDFCNCFKFIKIKSLVIRIDKHIDCNRCQITHSNFSRAGVLNNFSAQVAALDCTDVLMIRFSIAVILIKHIRSSSFYLRPENGDPYIPGLYLLFIATFLFISIKTIYVWV